MQDAVVVSPTMGSLDIARCKLLPRQAPQDESSKPETSGTSKIETVMTMIHTAAMMSVGFVHLQKALIHLPFLIAPCLCTPVIGQMICSRDTRHNKAPERPSCRHAQRMPFRRKYAGEYSHNSRSTQQDAFQFSPKSACELVHSSSCSHSQGMWPAFRTRKLVPSGKIPKVCACMCVRVCACVCRCVRVCPRVRVHLPTYVYVKETTRLIQRRVWSPVVGERQKTMHDVCIVDARRLIFSFIRSCSRVVPANECNNPSMTWACCCVGPS